MIESDYGLETVIQHDALNTTKLSEARGVAQVKKKAVVRSDSEQPIMAVKENVISRGWRLSVLY